MDEDEWMEPYAVPVGDEWGEGGAGGSTPCKGAGEEAEADRAVEQYWESRGRSPLVGTVFGEADVLDGDGAGTVDAGMEEAAELEEEEECLQPKSWSEELRAKKRRTDGDKRTEELQKVRDLGRVRQAAFDKKK